MKVLAKVLLCVSFVFSSLTAFAGPETEVANCKMTPTDLKAWPSGKEIGEVKIYSSDNGGQGFLRFEVSGPSVDEANNTVMLTGSFTDNVQQEGAAFLNAGELRIYTPVEASDFDGAAIYLQNVDGTISGLIKLEFFRAKLACVAL